MKIIFGIKRQKYNILKMKDNLTKNDKNEFPDISVYNDESIIRLLL